MVTSTGLSLMGVASMVVTTFNNHMFSFWCCVKVSHGVDIGRFYK